MYNSEIFLCVRSMCAVFYHCFIMGLESVNKHLMRFIVDYINILAICWVFFVLEN